MLNVVHLVSGIIALLTVDSGIYNDYQRRVPLIDELNSVRSRRVFLSNKKIFLDCPAPTRDQ